MEHKIHGEKMKAVIDTGTMITLSGTCLMNVFKSFVKTNKIELMISSTVAQESVWKPITNKRFALSAARIKYAMNEQTIKTIPITPEISVGMQRILQISNNIFFTRKLRKNLIHFFSNTYRII